MKMDDGLWRQWRPQLLEFWVAVLHTNLCIFHISENVRRQSKNNSWANSLLNPYFEESELFKFHWNHDFRCFENSKILFNLKFVPRGMFMLRRKAEQGKFSKMQIDKTNFKVNQNWASFVWPQNFLKFQQSLKLDE